ncbi:hypothetical protein QP150_16185 [Sphingomonas sp. 22L2VL55-3]
MNHHLDGERARLHRLLTAADHDSLSRGLGMTAALEQARHLDQVGDIDDTRQLASVLTRMASAAAERGDNGATALAAGELLAVLADIADDGDEDVAIGVNASAADVSPFIIGIACEISRRRRRMRQS